MGGPARKKPRMEEIPPPKAQGRSDDEKGATSSILDDSLCAMEEKGAAGEEAVACPFTESCASDEENELLAEGEKLTGAALKRFLQRNFIDYIDQRKPFFAELEEKNTREHSCGEK
ncbi:hypothetical protein TcG_05956 [Trypanosoma cruzi]|nr:hypothetical protein TcG_05956 [Trypanosoma cruzi]